MLVDHLGSQMAAQRHEVRRKDEQRIRTLALA